MHCNTCGAEMPDDGTPCPNCKSPVPGSSPETFASSGGKLPNKDIMRQAKDALKGRWGLAIGTTVIFYLITIGIGFIPYAGSIASMVIGGPMVVGFCIFFLSLSRKKEARLGQIFEGFQKFGVAFRAYVLTSVFILLWMLLLIVPGIMAAFSYSQTFYILADSDTTSTSAMEALRRSRAIMRGNRWKLFCLNCRFIGWGLLCLLTLGIGFLWLAPYVETSLARFYDDVKVKDPAPVANWRP